MNNIFIKFNVSHQKIIRMDNTKLVSGSRNYVKAKFEFSDDWKGLTKTAVFKRNSVYNVLVNDEDNSCLVPWEVLTEAGSFEVSVFAGELITATSVTVSVDESGYKRGGSPSDPTPSIYSQIVKLLDEIKVEASETTIKQITRDYLDDLNIVTEENVDEITERVVAYYFEEHKSEFKGDKGERGLTGARGEQGIKGDKGDSGVYVGSMPPNPSEYPVWINVLSDATETEFNRICLKDTVTDQLYLLQVSNGQISLTLKQ